MTLFWSFWFSLSISKKHDAWLVVFYVTGNAGSIREVRAVQILLAKFFDCMPEKIHHRERPMLQARAGGSEPNDLSLSPVEEPVSRCEGTKRWTNSGCRGRKWKIDSDKRTCTDQHISPCQKRPISWHGFHCRLYKPSLVAAQWLKEEKLSEWGGRGGRRSGFAPCAK